MTEENACDLVDFNRYSLAQEKVVLQNALAQFSGKRIAVIAASDYIARNVIDMLHELNLKVPEQVGVVSFYGTRLATDYPPKLSCISIRPENLGKAAADLLISKDTRYGVHEIPMEFMFGETI